MDVHYFRRRKDGPESEIEDAVAHRIPELFGESDLPVWTAGSVPIGAGRPDLVVVCYRPRVLDLAGVEMPAVHVLAYLRAVRWARLETIAERLGQSTDAVSQCLDRLVEIEVVAATSDTYSLEPVWREILPEVVTIEVKVAHWRRAVQQAARNRILAHRSFVALPDRVARRVRRERIFSMLGVGVLAVRGSSDVSVVRKARSTLPTVWTYYYRLASMLAMHTAE